jgi:hypothetical protein
MAYFTKSRIFLEKTNTILEMMAENMIIHQSSEARMNSTRLLYFAQKLPQLDGEALRPGDENGVFGATELIHLEYWAACHNYIATDGASPKLAKKLGYHLAPAPND